VTLFAPAPERPRKRSRTVGWVLLAVAVVLTIVASSLPSPYVIELPGPVFNTIGTQQQGKKEVDLISIDGQKTYETKGTLDMLTVSVAGTADQRPSWLQVVRALFTKSQAVVPASAIYPPGESTDDVNKQDAADMTASQQSAVAAALVQQGYQVPSKLTVGSVAKGTPAAGVLRKGDVVTAVNGTSLATNADTTTLRDLIAANGSGKAATVSYLRGGAQHSASITPSTLDGSVVLGIGVTESFDFPFTVDFGLQDVGGPSAGMMFALGIIDEITPGYLNGGKNVAGTGTITAGGQVGAIGGIRQKLYGAKDAGATVFLAPASNCDEVVGHVPSGLDVYSVSTLKQAVTDLGVIAKGGDTSSLARCGS
jgi:Lon-like protease